MGSTEIKISSDNSDLDDKKMKSSAYDLSGGRKRVDIKKHRFPNCIVWTPLPILSWFFPFIGHMGIANTSGVIFDFAGPYFVSEDNMAFGWPTKYWMLDLNKTKGALSFDRSVEEASVEYGKRMHNLFCDNCHSHVAMALNKMEYDDSTSWNMVKLCFLTLIHGKYVGVGGFIKTWLPFFVILGLFCGLFVYMS